MRRLKGIRRVGDLYEVYGRVGDKQFSRRFPGDTPLSVMRVWREEQLRERRAANPRAEFGTLAEAVQRFLKLETGRRHRDFELLLRHWTETLGSQNRAVLSPKDIQTQLDTWRAQGVALSTLNHRRQALRTLYRRLEPDLPNPVDKTRGYREPEPEPRAIPDDVMDAIFNAMPDSVTKARLLVICHTGVRHSELMRIRPEDVEWDENPHVFVRSGKGGRHRVVPLHGRALGALAALALYEGWGVFNTSAMRKSWLTAALAAGHARLDPESKGKTWTNILCEYRPYDLRHRFATRVRQLGADLADVQELLGHKDIRTTRRYAPVVHAKLVSVVNALVENDDEQRSGGSVQRATA